MINPTHNQLQHWDRVLLVCSAEHMNPGKGICETNLFYNRTHQLGMPVLESQMLTLLETACMK